MVNRHTKDNSSKPILWFVLAFFLALFSIVFVMKKIPINPDKILKEVKQQFKANGPIDGSWIEMTKIPFEKDEMKTDVYYGGVSLRENGHLVQYEFMADAYSGEVIDLYKI